LGLKKVVKVKMMKAGLVILGLVIAIVGLVSIIEIKSLFLTISNPLSWFKPYSTYAIIFGVFLFIVGLVTGRK